MAAFDFPASPTDGQTYTLNGVTYKYSSADGAWIGGPLTDTGLWQPKDANLTAIASLADAAVGVPELDGVGGAVARPVATIAEFRAGTATPRVLGNKSIWDAADFVVLPYAASITPDMATGINFACVLTGNLSLVNPTSNPPIGRSGAIYLAGASAFTLTWGTAWRFPGGIKPGAIVASSVPTIIYYLHAGPGIYYCNAGEAYA